jgi:DNA-binding MarR family transcriptional regulator
MTPEMDGAAEVADPLQVAPLDEALSVDELLMRVRLLPAAPRHRRTGADQVASPASPQAHALSYLLQHEASTVGELAAAIGVSVGWASRVADDLVQAGMAERVRDAFDRRVVRLQLTSAARLRGLEVSRERAAAVREALSPTSADERATIMAFLRRLADAYAPGPDRGKRAS